MMAKVKIVTGDTVPVYKWLQRANLNGVANASVSWNFNKFLIDENGHWVRHFDAPTLPTDTAITNWITSTSSTAGITNLNSSDFKIIKNQAKGEILIELPTNFPIHFTTSLTNMQGQVVKKINSIRAGSSSTFNISVSDLSSGIYYLNLKANAGAYIAKVVVEE
jgi:glutathione peroxidase-family protein